MKKYWMTLVLSIAMVLPLASCTTMGNTGKNWMNNIPRLKADIFTFSKLATRITLAEANTPIEDLKLIKGYLVALQDLLAVPGYPNFTGARMLVDIKLPQKYKVYGLTIIDVLERYLQTANLNITDDQETIIAIISSGINGALKAVQEFMEQ